MSDAFLDKFLADLVKGASSSLRENGGPGVNIVVARENRGREEKLASVPGVMGGTLLGGLGGGLGGGLAGAGTGALAAHLLHLDPSVAQELGGLLGLGGAGVGALGGAAAGAAAGKDDPSMLQRLKGGAFAPKLGFFTMSDPKQVAAQLLHGGGAAIRPSRATPPPIPAAAMRKGPPPIPGAAMKAAYDQGLTAAIDAFGIKEANPLLAALPAIGNVASKALPFLGRMFGAAKPALGRAGSFLMKNPVGQQVAGSVASNAVNRMMAPPQPQPAMG